MRLLPLGVGQGQQRCKMSSTHVRPVGASHLPEAKEPWRKLESPASGSLVLVSAHLSASQ